MALPMLLLLEAARALLVPLVLLLLLELGPVELPPAPAKLKKRGYAARKPGGKRKK